jgi:hypothetical protein
MHPDSILTEKNIGKLSPNYLSTEVSSDPIFYWIGCQPSQTPPVT